MHIAKSSAGPAPPRRFPPAHSPCPRRPPLLPTWATRPVPPPEAGLEGLAWAAAEEGGQV